MTSVRPWPFLVAAALLACTPVRAAEGDEALIRAWGGKPGIAAVMDDLVRRLKLDTRTAHFFRDSNATHLAAQLTEQLCQVAGGPCRYEGPTMREAHADMGLTRADFLALVELLQDSMAARRVPWDAQRAMLARLAPMHREIVAP
ncbi:MAG: group 1 truncated hemoglobin [Rubrivivax sp.]